jgi:hypothetical protein
MEYPFWRYGTREILDFARGWGGGGGRKEIKN